MRFYRRLRNGGELHLQAVVRELLSLTPWRQERRSRQPQECGEVKEQGQRDRHPKGACGRRFVPVSLVEPMAHWSVVVGVAA
jgi:hypothetical protein